MRSKLSFLLPAQPAPPIQCSKKISTEYRKWRWRILYSSFIGYAIYYFTRGSLAMGMPSLKTMGFDEVALGWLVSCFQVAYGISKFANGILADRANPRFFMAIGLVMTGIVNIFFGLSSSLFAFVVFWTLNGWFQGFGSAPCHRLLTHWYAKKERGRWWGIWNTSHNAGAALFPLLAVWLLQNKGWQAVMWVPGIIAIITGFFLINRLRDTPQSLGLPPIESFKKDKDSKSASYYERDFSIKEILFEHILLNKLIWFVAIANLMVYIIRWTISNWSFLFLVEAKGFENWQAARCILWFEVGGFIGSLAAGWVSDLFFQGRRTAPNAIFMLMLIPAIHLFSLCSSSSNYQFLTEPVMGAIGFFIFGPQMLLAVQSTEVSHKKASATAVGFLGIIAYLASAVITGGPLGYVVRDGGGWQEVFFLLKTCTVIGIVAILTIPLLRKPTAAMNPKKA